MSSGLNKCLLIGRLGADAELRHGQNGGAILRLRLAVNERWKDANGEKKERTEWCTVVFFDKRAEGLSRHLFRGQSVYVEGRLQTREWEDKQGQKRFTTEIVGSELLFLGGKRDDGAQRRPQQPRAEPAKDDYPPTDDGGFGEDDIPFDRLRMGFCE